MGHIHTSVCATADPKDIKIGISFFLTFVKSSNSAIDYTTDLERFTNTYNHVNRHPASAGAYRLSTHKTLLELINSGAPFDERFFTIVMHYLVTYESVGVFLKSHPNTSLGFQIEPKLKDFNNAMVISMDYDSWELYAINRSAA